MLGIRHYKGIAIDLWQGDITTFASDTIVNAANPELQGGGGVDGAIHSVGGPSIMDECREIGSCPIGEAVFTKAGDLPAKFVIHTVGPKWKDDNQGEESLLKSSYQNSLKQAENLKCRHISFSAISCGTYGYPKEKASQVAFTAIKELIDSSLLHTVKRITIVLFSSELHNVFQDALFANFTDEEN